jgi:tRNA U34 5-methylaminomethyl-2-thiouridine-forming methyltransferase MnmC
MSRIDLFNIDTLAKELLMTADGSQTIRDRKRNITYHSLHGAIRESRHVYIEAGFNRLPADRPARVLETGMGTGLNALLTCVAAEHHGQPVYYTATEPFPLDAMLTESLDYAMRIGRPDMSVWLHRLHAADWEKPVPMSSAFTLVKRRRSVLEVTDPDRFDLIYHDAFAPDAQPELWTAGAFRELYQKLQEGGILVTYCSKGVVRRNMLSVGFCVEKLPGPPGKREILRAIRTT